MSGLQRYTDYDRHPRLTRVRVRLHGLAPWLVRPPHVREPPRPPMPPPDLSGDRVPRSRPPATGAGDVALDPDDR